MCMTGDRCECRMSAKALIFYFEPRCYSSATCVPLFSFPSSTYFSLNRYGFILPLLRSRWPTFLFISANFHGFGGPSVVGAAADCAAAIRWLCLQYESTRIHARSFAGVWCTATSTASIRWLWLQHASARIHARASASVWCVSTNPPLWHATCCLPDQNWKGRTG